MKNIPIGSWKKHNDYAWFTGHGNSFHTPIVDEIELHKIAVLTDKKDRFILHGILHILKRTLLNLII